jgi:hypothetical protein
VTATPLDGLAWDGVSDTTHSFLPSRPHLTTFLHSDWSLPWEILGDWHIVIIFIYLLFAVCKKASSLAARISCRTKSRRSPTFNRQWMYSRLSPVLDKVRSSIETISRKRHQQRRNFLQSSSRNRFGLRLRRQAFRVRHSTSSQPTMPSTYQQ